MSHTTLKGLALEAVQRSKQELGAIRYESYEGTSRSVGFEIAAVTRKTCWDCKRPEKVFAQRATSHSAHRKETHEIPNAMLPMATLQQFFCSLNSSFL